MTENCKQYFPEYCWQYFQQYCQMWMPAIHAIFECLDGNLLSVDGSATQLLASNTAGNIARCGCPFKRKNYYRSISVF